MSTSTTKDPVPLHTTRQLLDELDALMDRMLALPIEDGTDASAGGAAAVGAATPAMGATLTLIEPPGGAESPADELGPADADDAGQGERASSEEPASFQEPTPFETPTEFPSFDVPSYSTMLTPDRDDPPPTPSVVEVIAPTPQPLAPLPRRLRPTRSLGYQFLLWFNRSYDRGTYLLGPRGQGLRGAKFRLGLGLMGSILLAAALGWLAWDWMQGTP